METYITKRDGSREPFSVEKIKSAIAKAFLSVGSFAMQDVITNILSRVSITNETSVEDTQNQVEMRAKETTHWTANKEETGVVTWEEEIVAGEIRAYQFSYGVKYPKGMNLNL